MTTSSVSPTPAYSNNHSGPSATARARAQTIQHGVQKHRHDEDADEQAASSTTKAPTTNATHGTVVNVLA